MNLPQKLNALEIHPIGKFNPPISMDLQDFVKLIRQANETTLSHKLVESAKVQLEAKKAPENV